MKKFSDLQIINEESEAIPFEETLSEEDNFFFDDGITTLPQNGEKLLLRMALRQLTDTQRKVIQGIYFDGTTHTALAKQLKITRQAVEKHLQTALNKLRKICLGPGMEGH